MKYFNNAILLLIFFFFHTVCQSQTYGSNMILIIDNKIVTERIDMNFYSNDSIVYNHLYEIGKELKIDTEIAGMKNTFIRFNYYGNFKDNIKNYKYNFEFNSGWLNNTNYLIIRIYNLDKKEFKRAFCNETKGYAVEVQNQVYYQAEILCKELKVKF